MDHDETNTALRDLQTLFEVGAIGRLSDGQLVEQFLARRDAAAFEALMRRHGPMVWGVCRRVLRDHHDAEDAFQASFLVLARKADSVLPREKVGHWLYGVACTTATKAKMTRARRRMRQGPGPDLPEPMPVRADPPEDLPPHLDRELSRLPEKYRAPIVLCLLEGKTQREAAGQLGWPIGTLSGRLARAKALLARRLSRRGPAVSGGALTLLLAREAASASLPAECVGPTARASVLIATGRSVTSGVASAAVAILARETLKTMWLTKVKFLAAILMVSVTLAAAATGLARRSHAKGRGAGGIARGNPQNPREDRPRKGQSPAPEQPVPLPGKPGVAFGDGGNRSTSLPGDPQASFGGGPGEPRYQRYHNYFFVTSPIGDKFSIYDYKRKRVTNLQLPASNESPLRVMPIVGDNVKTGTGYMALRLEGPTIKQLYIYGFGDDKWYPLDLEEPASWHAYPTLIGSVGSFHQERNIYSFSTKTKKWSTFKLPEEAPDQPNIQTNQDSIVVEYEGHIHEFRGATGEWTHTDLRALIDSAIESADKPEP